ncbi:hypothetical protein G6O69_03800 [Pseudenhygromyxa sp. WMMC2535]|uniref:hypothetical protein n=1 Tax=Pseudenhygromyxa sp. WMMC2535 TaxID=2712867 RepID=UPI0015542FB8|nr:hypothetical protein [Pseudenhygromyxa sp. WMMC2535]NVB36940.1 hypothetical protein [Pseudenhygromyxa sp. WMMC2535]
MSHRHALELLAADHGYLVQICRDCDVVHVDVGPVTLRVRPKALASLTEVLTRACHRLESPQAKHPPCPEPKPALVN